jgi:hypothetical protein
MTNPVHAAKISQAMLSSHSKRIRTPIFLALHSIRSLSALYSLLTARAISTQRPYFDLKMAV